MRAGLYVIFVLTICSCSSDKKADNSLFEIIYTERVSPKKAQAIADYIAYRQNESGYMNGVERIKIDSSHFSYQLLLTGRDTIIKRNAFQAFAKLLSDELLDSMDVHVFITDKSFSNIIVPYKFSTKSMIYGRQMGVSRDLKISFPADMDNTTPRALFDELSVNVPELLTSGDTLVVDIHHRKENYVVDIYVDPDKLDIPKLKTQFKEAYCASLIYNILFKYTPTYINVRNSDTKEAIFVMTHGI